MQESERIARAKAGDRDAFAQLYTPVERPLAAFLYRLTAMRQDAEDLAQKTALRALENVDQCLSSFRIWIFRLAARAGLEYLSARKPWDPDLQIRTGQKIAENASLRRKLQQLHGSTGNTTYHIAEHVDFCFTCMGRTLPPNEQSALLLAEIHGFTAGQAAEPLDVPMQLVRSRVEQARRTLVGHFETRCGLINRSGSCHQCAGFDTLLHGDRRHTDEALFALDLPPHPTPGERAATLDQRFAIVRTIDPLHAEGTKLHDFLMSVMRQGV